MGVGPLFVGWELTSGSVRLGGSFLNETLYLQAGTDWYGAPAVYPIVNATLVLAQGTWLDPSKVVLTLLGPNGTILFLIGSGSVKAPRLTEIFQPDTIPHWMPCQPDKFGEDTCWTGYSVTFTNPDGLEVGGSITTGPLSTHLDSGARMSISFPGGPGTSPNVSGFELFLNDTEASGSIVFPIQ